MEPLLDRLALVRKHVTRALETANADAGASPVLRAVVVEFQKKMEKTLSTLTASPTEMATREAVVEVEQAGDSANVAAMADAGASAATKKAVEVAHKAMCLVKFED